MYVQKKIIYLILPLFILSMMLLPVSHVNITSATPANDYSYGDVNGDGSINVTDAILVLRHIVGLHPLSSDEKVRADVDGNGIINVSDAIFILRRIVGLVDDFPVEVWEPYLNYKLELGDNVESLAFSPDGEIIAAGLPIDTNLVKPPRAELFSVEDGEYVGYIETNHTPQDMSYSPDGTILGIGVNTPGVSIYDVDDGTEIRRLHSGFDNRLAFAPDGKTLATGNRSSIIWLWQVEDGEELAAFEAEGDPGWTSGIDFTHDGNYVIAGYLYGSILFWEISSGHIVNSFDVGERWLIDIALSPDGTILAASTNSTTYIIDLTQNTIIKELTLNVGYTYQMGLDFSPDGALLAIGGVEGIVNVYNTTDWSLLYSFEHFTTDNEQSRIRSLAFSPDSKKMAVGTGPVGRYEGALYQYSIQRP